MYRLRSLFGYLVVFILLSAALILILIQGLLHNPVLFERLLKFFCRVIPRVFGMRIRVSGLPDPDPENPCIYVSNHVNLFDPVILFGHIPRSVRGLELDTHFRYPLWGAIIRGLGNIPVSHRDARSAHQSLEDAGRRVKEGTSLIVFPEGHRTRNGEMQSFGSGAFRIAESAGVQIVPVALKGLYERKTVHSFFVKPGPVNLIFGEPVSQDHIRESKRRDLAAETKALIQGLLDS